MTAAALRFRGSRVLVLVGSPLARLDLGEALEVLIVVGVSKDGTGYMTTFDELMIADRLGPAGEGEASLTADSIVVGRVDPDTEPVARPSLKNNKLLSSIVVPNDVQVSSTNIVDEKWATLSAVTELVSLGVDRWCSPPADQKGQ